MKQKKQMEKKEENEKTKAYSKEMLRKGVHIVLGALALYLTWIMKEWYGIDFIKEVAMIVLIIFLVLDMMRIELQLKIPFVAPLERKKESKTHLAVTFATISFIILISLFDFTIAFAALGMSYFGDAAAALVGMRFGKRILYKNKTFEGASANFIVCFFVGFFFIGNIFIVMAMAFTAALVELFLDKLEDNLYIPLATALLGQVLLWLV